MLMLVPSLTSAQPGEWTKPTPPYGLTLPGCSLFVRVKLGAGFGRIHVLHAAHVGERAPFQPGYSSFR